MLLALLAAATGMFNVGARVERSLTASAVQGRAGLELRIAGDRAAVEVRCPRSLRVRSSAPFRRLPGPPGEILVTVHADGLPR
jgi:hypothetical protein